MNKTKAGFSIVELLVAMSLFLTLVALATGTFIQTLKTQKIITGLSAANDNASQAIEQITREVRTGFGFSESTKSVLKFTNYKNESVSFKLMNGSITRCVGECLDDVNFRGITAPEVKVERLEFIVSGKPTRVTIVLSIAGSKDIKVNLQTSVSSRIVEL